MREHKFIFIYLRDKLEFGMTVQEAKEEYLKKNNTILTDKAVENQLKKHCIQNRNTKKFYYIKLN
jgi:hypothetical protein